MEKNSVQCPFCRLYFSSKSNCLKQYSDTGGGHGEKEFSVVCPNCGACGPKCATKKEAIASYTVSKEISQ